MKGKKREKLWQKQKLDLPNDLFFQSAYSLASLLPASSPATTY